MSTTDAGIPFDSSTAELVDLRYRLGLAVRDPDAVTLTWYRAGGSGRGPAAFADTCIEMGLAGALGIDRTELERIGAAFVAATTARGRTEDSTRRKAARIMDAEARRLVRQVRRGQCVQAAQFFLVLIDMLRAEYRRETGAGVWPELKYATAFGHVQRVIEHRRNQGLPFDPDAIVDHGSKGLRGTGISRTDVRTAVDIFTRKVPLNLWLAPAQTEK